MLNEITRYWYTTRWQDKTVDIIAGVLITAFILGTLVLAAGLNPAYDVH